MHISTVVAMKAGYEISVLRETLLRKTLLIDRKLLGFDFGRVFGKLKPFG